ncbi:hypothetical protein GCM10009868_37530 [Terrabacter aerolatus]|uniref:Uncharacterized protein n=1 Tax=Terrabacter aerolatus TaxID=422442 RepID=A0A512CVK9_9MICO|nr:hypothetical protein TAE01_00740 [Terrabacter aerolatus]
MTVERSYAGRPTEGGRAAYVLCDKGIGAGAGGAGGAGVVVMGPLRDLEGAAGRGGAAQWTSDMLHMVQSSVRIRRGWPRV